MTRLARELDDAIVMPTLERLQDRAGDMREDLRLGIGMDAGLEAREQEQVLDDAQQPLGLAGDVGHH